LVHFILLLLIEPELGLAPDKVMLVLQLWDFVQTFQSASAPPCTSNPGEFADALLAGECAFEWKNLFICNSSTMLGR
jgi:hypothetical protein